MKNFDMLANGNTNKIDASAKLESLKKILSEMESVLIAYSGGVDSTFLLKVALDVLGDKTIAVTARSATYSSRELEEARKNATLLGAKHIIIDTNELHDENFVSNPPERCYYCKKELFSRLLALARQYSLNYVVDGSNYDDIHDFRPGMKAASEFGIRSPLKEAMLTKEEVRKLSKEMNLPTWNKPPSPCLATRFPYGTRITAEELSKVERAEEFLAGFGIEQLRVRVHGNVARIEVLKKDMHIFFDTEISEKVVERFKSLGYTYVTLDLQGYRMGSMNEILQGKSEIE